MTHQRNAIQIWMTFRWRVDRGPWLYDEPLMAVCYLPGPENKVNVRFELFHGINTSFY